MEVYFGQGETGYGPGVLIEMSGEEIAIAIHAYLVAHRVFIQGPCTITVNDALCEAGQVYVDPSGSVNTLHGKFHGSGRFER